jgi:hypothetical protein
MRSEALHSADVESSAEFVTGTRGTAPYPAVCLPPPSRGLGSESVGLSGEPSGPPEAQGGGEGPTHDSGIGLVRHGPSQGIHEEGCARYRVRPIRSSTVSGPIKTADRLAQVVEQPGTQAAAGEAVPGC